MPSLRQDTARQHIVQRLQNLTPATKPKWGQFDAPRRISHLIDSLAISLGEVSTGSGLDTA